MQKYFDTVQGSNGAIISGGSVSVYSYGSTSLAPLFADRAGTIPLNNPVITNALGYFEFYAANGDYTIAIAAAGFIGQSLADVQMEDPDDLAAYLAAANAAIAVQVAAATTQATNAATSASDAATAASSAVSSKANLASPTFTGTVSGITAAMVGLSNVNNTTDSLKPISTAQATAIALKANIASPTFTGTVAGITQTMVGLANVDNTTDALKPVSTATQTALNLKVSLDSSTGAARIPAGTTAQRPVAPVAGDTRLNTTLNSSEVWSGTVWTPLSGAASGANSDITSLSVLSSINGGQLGGMRNRILNGSFLINQRAVTGTVTLAAGAYGHDRFKAGAGGCTYTFATVQNETTLTLTAGTLQQVIEGSNLMSGGFVLSWTGTATGRIDSGVYGASGITGTAVGGTNQTVEFGTGTVSKVMYERGTVGTAFEMRPIGLELALCQRYYQFEPTVIWGGNHVATGLVYFPYRTAVAMRTSPVVTFPGAAYANANGLAISYASTGVVGLQMAITSTGHGFTQTAIMLNAEL